MPLRSGIQQRGRTVHLVSTEAGGQARGGRNRREPFSPWRISSYVPRWKRPGLGPPADCAAASHPGPAIRRGRPTLVCSLSSCDDYAASLWNNRVLKPEAQAKETSGSFACASGFNCPQRFVSVLSPAPLLRFLRLEAAGRLLFNEPLGEQSIFVMIPEYRRGANGG
jgi:hypothetical protein